MALTITAQHKHQFQAEGYFILERVIGESDLTVLRDELDRFIAKTEAAMDASGTDEFGLNRRGRRYFIAVQSASSFSVGAVSTFSLLALPAAIALWAVAMASFFFPSFICHFASRVRFV